MIERSPFAVGFRAGAELIAERAVEPQPQPLLQTGLWPLDYALGGGFRLGEVSVVCAPTGHGKSAIAEQIALAISKEHRTTFFALEMGRRRTTFRMLAKILHWDLKSVENLWNTDRKHKHLLDAITALMYEHHLIIEERAEDEQFTADHLFEMAIQNEPRFIVIDGPRDLDDWNGSADGKMRTDLAAAAIARRFVFCAKCLNAHVMVVAQTTRALLSRKPSARDVADTYVLAQRPDTVIMLHRPYRGQGFKDVVAEAIIDKNRNGPEGIVPLRWHGSRMTYGEMSPSEMEQYLKDSGKQKASSVAPLEAVPTRDDDIGEPYDWGNA